MSLEFNGAFSQGTSQRSKIFASYQAQVPGPGNYQMPNFKDKARSTQTVFSKSSRDIRYGNGNPGPGTYKPTFAYLDKQLGTNFGKKHQALSKPQMLGPGSYDPKYTAEGMKLKSPTYGFGYRLDNQAASENPAPNTYFANGTPTSFQPEEYLQKQSQMSLQRSFRRTNSSSVQSRASSRNGFGSSPRLRIVVSDVPGPGEYYAKLPTTSVSTRFSRGSRSQLRLSDNPGPGTFDPITPGSSSRRGFSLGKKLSDPKATYTSFVPGPGTYDGKEIETQACVKFGLEEKHNIVDNEAAKKPAPNAYYPLLSSPRNDMNVPTIGFGERQRMTQSVHVPGPGEYQPKQTLGEGPKWKMAAKLPTKNKIDFPGPGTYDMDRTEFLSQRPRFSSTTGQRSSPARSQVTETGPGSYNISGNLYTNRFYASIGKRFSSKINFFEPGPGSYNVSGTIGKIPSYLMLAKKRSSQLLDYQS